MRPKYYHCGICDHTHSILWDGDCREDAARFHPDDLDSLHGLTGWDEVDAPGDDATTPDGWLASLFESEYCAECGGDAQHHTAVPFMGNWHAFCDFPRSDDDASLHPTIKKFHEGLKP